MIGPAGARPAPRVAFLRRDSVTNPGLSLPLGVALMAWVALAGLSRLDGGLPLCLGVDRAIGSQFRSALAAQWAMLDPIVPVGWGVMVLAMMLPIAASHLSVAVAKCLPCHRWQVLVAASLGYLAVWLLLGVPFIALHLLAAAVDSLAAWPAVPLVTYAAAIGWCMAPPRRKALRKCHPVPAFFGSGRSQSWAAGLWGVRLAGHCAAVCFFVMAAPMLSGQGMTGMMIATQVLLSERVAPRPEPARVALPLALLLAVALLHRLGSPP